MVQILIKRGLEANRLNVTPDVAEMLYTTDEKKLYFGDGSTAGGIALSDSAAEILAKIITVDGTGSGLDLDQVGGFEGSQLLRNDQDGTLVGTLTLNDTIFAAITQTVNANTVVDVFLYDTTKDSDGGQWRKRTQHLSWYNETLNTATRGATKEFPAVALIVAEATTVTIYDATNSDCPMWMVFTRAVDNILHGSSSRSSIVCNNATLVVGALLNSISVISFISENSYRVPVGTYRMYNDNILNRNNTSGWTTTNGEFIIDNAVNDVAITVLPNAPIDTETSLPIPTIAVATDGGVSIIHNNGSVNDITFISNNVISNISFNEDDNIIFSHGGLESTQSLWRVYELPTSDILSENHSTVSSALRYYRENTIPAIPLTGNGTVVLNDAIALDDRLCLVKPDDTQDNDMINYITKDYQTGWMHGDIKGAFLSSTDSSSLVASGEIITNGTFDTDVTEWNNFSDGRSSISFQTNKLRISNIVSNGGNGIAWQIIPTVVGQNYTISCDTFAVTTPYARRIYAGTSEGSTNLGTSIANVDQFHTFNFVATTTSVYVSLHIATTTDTAEVDFDNVTVKLTDDDRSINKVGVVANGTITRTAVATGAELMGYSGFSATNFLEQPHNPDLDFGTGDFYMMGWFKYTGIDQQIILSLGRVGWFVYIGIKDNIFRLRLLDTVNQSINQNILATSETPESKWTHVVGRRINGSATIFIDGNDELVSGENNISFTDSEFSLTAGTGVNIGSTSPVVGDVALLRIGAGAPSADQINEIYESERHLFKENAACTLSSTTNSAVNALAYDDDTQLLHVAGTDNLDAFDGLVRTSSEVGAYTSLSANNGVVAKGN